MKNTFKTKLLLFIFAIILFFSPICIASDVSPISSDEGIEATSDDGVDGTYEFIASDVYEFENDVVIDTIIDGNAFAFGNNITITGEVGGDVFAFGSNVTVAKNSYVHGNIFVCAENFVMNGICYDIYAVSESFTLGENAIVARDIRVGSDSIHINGQVKRDAYITTNELVFPEKASTLIVGNLDYTSSSEFVIAEGIVGGNINFTQEVTEESSVAEKITSYVTDILSTLLYSLAIIVLTIWMAPKFKEKASVILEKQAPLSFGVGLLASIAIVVGSFVLLFITNGLGVGISVAAITVFILSLTISKTVFSMACAKLISSKLKKDNNVIFIAMSLLFVLVISLLELIPTVGGFVGFAVAMIGFGILLLNLIGKKNSDDKVEEVNSAVIEENK